MMSRIRGRHAAACFLVAIVTQIGCDTATGPGRAFLAELPVEITSMSPAQWNAIATRLDAVDKPLNNARTISRTCTGCPNNLMTVEVAAMSDAQRVGRDKTPKNGVVVARIIPTTTSTGTESRYGLADGRFAYLFVVTPPSGAATFGRWSFIKYSFTLDSLNNTRTYTHVGAVSSGVFTPCNHPLSSGPADASFATCATSPAMKVPPAEKRDRTVQRFVNQLQDDPLWVSCIAGCCIAES
jgi:hypothetical protein